MGDILPMFSQCDSLAVKYLVDEIFNRLQLSDPQNVQRGFVDPEAIVRIHKDPFTRGF